MDAIFPSLCKSPLLHFAKEDCSYTTRQPLPRPSPASCRLSLKSWSHTSVQTNYLRPRTFGLCVPELSPNWQDQPPNLFAILCTKSLQSCLTLCDPMDLAHQAPLSMGFSRQECWSRMPCPCPEDLPKPGIEPVSLTSLALAGRFLTTSANWEAQLLVWSNDKKPLFSKSNVQLTQSLHTAVSLNVQGNWWG